MDSDPYSTFASFQSDQIRRYAEDFFAADDAIKAANLELKPYRLAKKEAKEKLEELMKRSGRVTIDLEERGERLELGNRKAKRIPQDDTIRERCVSKFRGNAETIFNFIKEEALVKVEETVAVLKRKKITAVAEASDDDDQ